MNYVPLSSPRKILQPLPWQPLNNEQVTAMLLVTVTPWLKGVFIGIGRDGSLSHRRPVSLHTPDHSLSSKQRCDSHRQATFREHRAPRQRPSLDPRETHPQIRVQQLHALARPSSTHVTALGTRPQALQVPKKKASWGQTSSPRALWKLTMEQCPPEGTPLPPMYDFSFQFSSYYDLFGCTGS